MNFILGNIGLDFPIVLNIAKSVQAVLGPPKIQDKMWILKLILTEKNASWIYESETNEKSFFPWMIAVDICQRNIKQYFMLFETCYQTTIHSTNSPSNPFTSTAELILREVTVQSH